MTEKSDLSPEDIEARVLIITRSFDAPRELVFKVWTQPEHVVHWWGPIGFTVPVCEMDVRPGGAWRMCMRSEAADYWHSGIFQEVVAPERLVFTHTWLDDDGTPGHETLVTVTFVEHDGSTQMTFRQGIFESTEMRDDHEGGWNECFDLLAEQLVRLGT